MDIKITCPNNGLVAGYVYSLPDRQSATLIAQHKAIEVVEAGLIAPAFVETPKRKPKKEVEVTDDEG